MAKSVHELLQDLVLDDTIELEGIVKGNRKKIRKELDRLERKLITLVASEDFTDEKDPVKRRAKIRTVLRNSLVLSKVVYDKMKDSMAKDLAEIARYEGDFVKGVINTAAGGTIATEAMSPTTINKVIANAGYKGVPSKAVWASQLGSLQTRFRDSMKEAYRNNEDLASVIQRVRGTSARGFKDGILRGKSLADATTLARTAIHDVANEARLMSYEANSDVVSGVEFYNVLDARTTHICAATTGQKWVNNNGNYEPIDGAGTFRRPPLHPNCRSTLLPILHDSKDLPKNKEKEVPAKKKKQLGKTGKPQTADGWLKKQPVSKQKEYLGTAYLAWTAGKISARDFLTRGGRTRTPEEVAELRREQGIIK